MADALTVEQDGVKRFNDPTIQAAVEQALASLPAGRKVAVVAHGTLTGASLSAVVKLGDSWSVMAACYKPYKGPLVTGAFVRWSPF